MTTDEAIQQIQALDLKPGSVLVVKTAGSPTAAGKSIAEVLRSAGIDDVVVIAVAAGDDVDLTVLDAGAMLEYGWQRVPDPMAQLKAIRVAAMAAMEAERDGR